jgi:hypothetical protein
MAQLLEETLVLQIALLLTKEVRMQREDGQEITEVADGVVEDIHTEVVVEEMTMEDVNALEIHLMKMESEVVRAKNLVI